MHSRLLRVKIADLVMQIATENTAIFEHLSARFKDFFSEEKAHFSISLEPSLSCPDVDAKLTQNCSFNPTRVSLARKNGQYLVLSQEEEEAPVQVRGVIEAERKSCRLLARESDLDGPLLIDSIRACLHLFLERENGFLLHASGAIYEGAGYLFTGPGDCGKTTAVGKLPEGTVLSDECLALRAGREGVEMFGTPFHQQKNVSAILKSIFFPRKAKEVSFQRISPSLALQEIFSNTYHGILDKEMTEKRLNTVAELVKKVPCYQMHSALKSPIWERIGNLN